MYQAQKSVFYLMIFNYTEKINHLCLLSSTILQYLGLSPILTFLDKFSPFLNFCLAHKPETELATLTQTQTLGVKVK